MELATLAALAVFDNEVYDAIVCQYRLAVSSRAVCFERWQFEHGKSIELNQ